MHTHLDDDVRRTVLVLAAEEVKRRGDGRVGTEHLLLALLDGPTSPAAHVLQVGLDDARAALASLDRAALRLVGIDVGGVDGPLAVRTRRRPPLTSGAREVLRHAVVTARAERARRVGTRHLLGGVLSREHPDPAADLRPRSRSTARVPASGSGSCRDRVSVAPAGTRARRRGSVRCRRPPRPAGR